MQSLVRIPSLWGLMLLSQPEKGYASTFLPWYHWFLLECKAPMFGLKEPQDSTKFIDIVGTFVPQSVWSAVFKVASAIFAVSTMIVSFFEQDIDHWLIYLTHWSLIMATIYLLLSSTFVLFYNHDNNNDNMMMLIRVTWGMYSVAACAQITITILFWTLEYGPLGLPPTYSIVAQHGLLVIPVLGDGVLLNRIPIRMRQVIWMELYGMLYLTWSMVHAWLGVGKTQNDEESIYAVLDWINAPGLAATVSIATVCVAIPLVFLLVWSLSMMGTSHCRFDGSRRRFLPQHDSYTPAPEHKDTTTMV